MICCDDAELVALTHRTRPSAQVRVLRAMGIEHRVRPDGTVAVSRAHVEHLLGGKTSGTVEKEHVIDWKAVNA